jgi:RNA polymerase sigma-70 factor (ECF subfamily)
MNETRGRKMALPDAQLVERTLQGDLEGFGELHRRYFERVVRIVSGIVGERADAEDTAQNAYLAALRALPSLGNPDRFYPWLCRIAVNRAIEGKRSAQRRNRLHTDWILSESSPASRENRNDALERLENRERAGEVKEALEQLPEGMKAAVILRYFDGLSMRKVAEALGCEEVTARTQIFRGLQKLGRQLGRMESDKE